MPWLQTTQKVQLLGIFAHPHDLTHALGTMGNHIQNGDSVTVAIVTDGGGTHNERLFEELRKDESERDAGVVEQQRQEYTEQKYDEARHACALFGVDDVRFLGFPDKPLHASDEIVDAVAELICEVRPDVLITEVPQQQTRSRLSSGQDDHTMTSAIVNDALVVASHPRHGQQRVPHKPARLYYCAPSQPGDEVDVYVDISEWEEQRIEAELSYQSQGHTPAYARQRIMRLYGSYGWSAGVNLAEKFLRGNPNVTSLLPVTDLDLKTSEGSGIDRALNVMGDDYKKDVEQTIRTGGG